MTKEGKANAVHQALLRYAWMHRVPYPLGLTAGWIIGQSVEKWSKRLNKETN